VPGRLQRYDSRSISRDIDLESRLAANPGTLRCAPILNPDTLLEFIMTIRIVLASHSGYGHTQRLADSVAEGARSMLDVDVRQLDVADFTDSDWQSLAQADAIVFGAPTYMGGPSGQFKVFADATAKVWFAQGWKDKIAGGFTCSMAMSGDKFSTLQYFVTLAMQHSMIWVGTGMMPAMRPGHPDELNRLGGYIGVMAQADNVPPEQSPPAGDLATGRAYGARIAQVTRQYQQRRPL
jgi:NAD(P)H dehydrogenase (quinone)